MTCSMAVVAEMLQAGVNEQSHVRYEFRWQGGSVTCACLVLTRDPAWFDQRTAGKRMVMCASLYLGTLFESTNEGQQMHNS